jgi:hypothetical protein
VTVASPATDAINMPVVETPRGLVLFDALRRSDQVDAIFRTIDGLGKPPLALLVTHAQPITMAASPSSRRAVQTPAFMLRPPSSRRCGRPPIRTISAAAPCSANAIQRRRRSTRPSRHRLTGGRAVELNGLRIVPMKPRPG